MFDGFSFGVSSFGVFNIDDGVLLFFKRLTGGNRYNDRRGCQWSATLVRGDVSRGFNFHPNEWQIRVHEDMH